MEITQSPPLNAGPRQVVDNQPLTGELSTMANAYQIAWELKLNKLKPYDKTYILENLGNSDNRIVNEFVKSVAAEAEAAFNKVDNIYKKF